jgi:hypothetical protein
MMTPMRMTPTMSRTSFSSPSLVGALAKLAEALPTESWVAKQYHPDVRDHLKRKFQKGRDEALEAFSDLHSKRQPIIRL